ncbi:hypothetical protein [Lysinibacillus sp. 54212]|uniref:hypothetical protein n=1 Tax=Lysinibacillus sp. 54212 TaxID=3119829 RepID=UPI002FC71022
MSKYTYTNFEIDGVFTLLQPVYRSIFILSVIFLAMVIAKNIPTWIAMFFAAFASIVAGQLLWFSGIIVDELGLGGSATSTTLFLAIVTTNIVSVFVSMTKKKAPQKS